jgi:hypothetical protein
MILSKNNHNDFFDKINKYKNIDEIYNVYKDKILLKLDTYLDLRYEKFVNLLKGISEYDNKETEVTDILDEKMKKYYDEQKNGLDYIKFKKYFKEYIKQII